MKVFISFDFDRTLGDYSKAHGNAILEGIHETYGKKFQVNWFDISSAGLTDLQIITNLVHNHGIGYQTIFQSMDMCLYNIFKDFNKYSYQYPVELLTDAKNTLEILSQQNNVIMGLSTGNIKSIGLEKIRNTAIDEFFSFGSFGDEVFNRYQLLKLTKKRLISDFGFSKEDIAIHVGDAVLDVLSAKNAGFIPIGVATGNYSKEQLLKAGAKFVFQDISELNKNFDEILSSFQQKKYSQLLVIK